MATSTTLSFMLDVVGILKLGPKSLIEKARNPLENID